MSEAVKQEWFWRKMLYAVATIALTIAAAFGVIQNDQIDNLAAQATPLFGAVVTLIAAVKTNRGSDSPVTEEDLATAQLTPEAVAQAVAAHLDQLNPDGKHAATEAVNTVQAYIDRVRGS